MKNAFLLLLSLAVLGASPASARLRRPGVLHAELWLGNYEEKGRHWDMIQFNHGLHDLKQVYDNLRRLRRAKRQQEPIRPRYGSSRSLPKYGATAYIRPTNRS